MVAPTNESWNTFRNHILKPTAKEFDYLEDEKAHSCAPNINFKMGPEVIYVHNPRSWRFLEIPTYVREAVPSIALNFNPTWIDSKTTIINNNGRDQQASNTEKKEDSKQSLAALIAGLVVGIGAILFTGYVMAQSFKQTIDSSRVLRKLELCERDIKHIIFDTNTQLRINKVVGFRTELLNRSFKRNLADTIQDLVIIAGLTFATVGWGMSYSAPLMITGTVIVVATLISKFFTKSVWQNLEDDEAFRIEAQEAAEAAKILLKVIPKGGLYPSPYNDVEINVDADFHLYANASAPPMGT